MATGPILAISPHSNTEGSLMKCHNIVLKLFPNNVNSSCCQLADIVILSDARF